MATSVAALQVTVGADISKALSGLNKINSAVSSAGGFFGRAASTAVGFGAAMVGLNVLDNVAGAMHDTVGGAIALNSNLETNAIAFETLLGSGQKAQSFLGDLSAFAASTPFTLPDLETDSKRLLAFGFASGQVIPLLTDMGNAASALGTGQEGIDRMSLALGQMLAKGKVQGDELLQLTESGVNVGQVFDIMSQQTGKSVKALQKLQAAGKLDPKLFIAAFQTFSQTRFADLMDRQASSFQGIWENVGETLNFARGAVFAPLFQMLKDLGKAILTFTKTPAFAAWVARLQGWVGTGTTILGAWASTWSNLMKNNGLSFFQAGLTSTEMVIKAVFGPAAAGMFHNFIAILGQIPAFVSGTLIPAIGQLWTWLQTNLPSAWATLSAAVQAALAFLGPGFVQALTNLQAQWVLLQPQLLAAGASFGNLLTALMPVFDFLANNMGPILAGFGAAMAVAFTPAAFGIALTLIGAIAAALLTLASPIVLIGALIGLLTAAWVGNWGGIQDKVLAVWAVIQPIFAAIGQWLGGIGQLIGKVLGTGAATDWTKMLNPVTAAGTLLTAPNVQAGLGVAPGLLPTALAANAGTRIVDNTQAFDFTGLQINANDSASVQALLDRVTAAAAAGQSAASNTAPAVLVGGS
jgi:tape measure domain-containing protein